MIEVENVSPALPKGGLTALIGPNGAGKSTLLSLIARLLPLQAGRIAVNGLPVERTPGRELARELAILRQDTGLNSRLSVRDLETLPAGNGSGRSWRWRSARAPTTSCSTSRSTTSTCGMGRR